MYKMSILTLYVYICIHIYIYMYKIYFILNTRGSFPFPGASGHDAIRVVHAPGQVRRAPAPCLLRSVAMEF